MTQSGICTLITHGRSWINQRLDTQKAPLFSVFFVKERFLIGHLLDRGRYTESQNLKIVS